MKVFVLKLQDTYHCALLSAGSVLNVVDTVLSGQVTFSFIRCMCSFLSS